MQPILSIKDLCIQFRNDGIINPAVNSISFDVAKGEILAIVGESGSGKSVTALSILQLLPPNNFISGEIHFSGENLLPVDLLKMPFSSMKKIRGKHISMIFQEPMTSLNPVLNCGEQVSEVIRLHKKTTGMNARKMTLDLFEKVKLPEPSSVYHRYPHQLSGGQKQRVMIAMAMSCSPRLLIADEPTTALDVTMQGSILELIKELQIQNDMGVIFITHDLGVVNDIADRIIVLYRGKIVEQGSTKNIFQNARHPYTRALLACRPANQPKGKRLPLINDFMNEAGQERTPAERSDQQYSSDHLINKLPNDEQVKATASIVLEVKHISVSFPLRKGVFGRPGAFFKAVDDVSFSVRKGETIGLVGESGCGKTTLGRCILQLIKPVTGEIMLNGRNITTSSPAKLRHMRKDLQIVFQDPYGSLNPRIAIGNAILEPLKMHGLFGSNSERKRKVMEMLEKVSLQPDHYNRYPHQFSGGQRQRICIARALVLDPAFLVFDESVSALDVSVQAQVLNLLNDLKAEFGFTSIFISHDLSVVHYCCDRILVMHKGSIVESGDSDQVYHRPGNEYTQRLIAAIPGRKVFQSH